ncbi:HpcH/HpaI aldolase/citrate lyase family protein [Streptomyces decoyicus]|uniref:HpcH/HpaI aldolase/citrate lyase family protein n=1 Tax=Streptomyces decoyicus TaxID=249567 RepID=A0ABZ1FQT4_9ACTN|nr:aldolase/citrate lyase family protein [Streptomyces decoyicus]WSB72491.1 HpcH/HpaI aldolase/citrate lyase family protein [Streptomyces decoyicus]
MGQQESVATSLADTVREGIGAALAQVDADLARRYPGDPGTRQPVHTVYVPGDVFAADTVRSWGDQALAALDEHAPDAAALAAVLGIPDALAAEVHDRVRAKLTREPVEDLRIDFEDGYGPRPDAEEDEAAARAAALVAAACRGGTARPEAGGGTVAPYMGIRMKCMEAAVRDRGIRTLDIFLTGLMEAGGLPDGLVLTLPKVTYAEQVTAMVRLLEAFEKARGLESGRIGFEIQIETTQSILGADGRATVARMIEAAEGRATSLHYGTFDYSASCGVSAAHQSLDHPVADHAKAVMQVAAAGTGVRLSDGSTNVLPVGPTERVHDAWRLHHGLVRRSLARAYYQGWDMHPGHLPTRYAAVYAFYREGLEQAAARLVAYVAKAGGAVMDEPATAKALSGYLLRGLDCGAVDTAEVARLTGLTRADLDALAGRTVPTD